MAIVKFTQEELDSATPLNPSTNPIRGVADVGVNLLKGTLLGGKMLSDAVSANNPVSNTIESGIEGLDSLRSQGAKDQDLINATRAQNAEGKGTVAELGAAIKNFSQAPLDTISQGAGTILPALVAQRFVKTPVGKTNVSTAIGAGMGAGSVKGQIYDSVKQAHINAGKTEQEAEDLANQAQAYLGDNIDQIALGAGLGAVAGGTGVEKIASRLASKEIGEQASKGILKQTLLNAGKEAIPEAIQGGQERFASNVAQQREGFDVDTFEGVAGNAAAEALASAPLGGGFGAIEALSARSKAIDDLNQSEGGALTEAAKTAVASGASDEVLALPAPVFVADSKGRVANNSTAMDDFRETLGANNAKDSRFNQGDSNVSDIEQGNAAVLDSGTVGTGANNGTGSAINTVNPIDDTIGSVRDTTNAPIEGSASDEQVRNGETGNAGEADLPASLDSAKQQPSEKANPLENAKVGDVVDLGNGVFFRKTETGVERVVDDEVTSNKTVSILNAKEGDILERNGVKFEKTKLGLKLVKEDARETTQLSYEITFWEEELKKQTKIAKDKQYAEFRDDMSSDEKLEIIDRTNGQVDYIKQKIKELNKKFKKIVIDQKANEAATSELNEPFGNAEQLPNEVVGNTDNVPQTKEDLTGEPIDKEWTAFSAKSGTLSIPRAEMPQVKAENRGALVNFLNARDITSEQVEVNANELKPTQAEFSPKKVQKAKDFEGGNRSILISSDNHVLDGHHQWLASLEKGETIKAIKLNAPIAKLVEQVKEMPSTEVSTGAKGVNAPSETLSKKAKVDSLKEIAKQRASEFTPEETNTLLSEAENEQRAVDPTYQSATAARTDSNIAGNETSATGQAETRNEVTETPRSDAESQEREGVRPLVESIVKRRAAANQINKSKAFDNYLGLAKDFLNGKAVSPSRFKLAATALKNDAPLAEAFTKLAELAKSPAKETRATKANTLELFNQQIAEAKTADELRAIAKGIQEESALSDAQVQELDDLVMDKIDGLQVDEPNAETAPVSTTAQSGNVETAPKTNVAVSKESSALSVQKKSKNKKLDPYSSDVQERINFWLNRGEWNEVGNGFYARQVSPDRREVLTPNGYMVGNTKDKNGNWTVYDIPMAELRKDAQGRDFEQRMKDATSNNNLRNNVEPLQLTGETNEQILAREQAQKDADAEKAKAEAKAKADEDKRGLEAQQRKNANERPFEFGGDNKKIEQAVKSGSEDMFAGADDNKTESENAFTKLNESASEYGYTIDENGLFTTPSGKKTSVKVSVDKNRLRFEGSENGQLIATYQNNAESIGKFLEKYWYAEKAKKPVSNETPAPKPSTPLSLYDNAMDEYNKGMANVDDYKQAFNSVLKNEDAIKEYLNANFTKSQLFERGGARLESRYKSEKKTRVVDGLYSEMVSDFLLPSETGMTSYSANYGDERYSDIKKQVEAITQESLDVAMNRRKEAIEKNRAKRVERLEGMQNPETLDDYTNVLRSNMNEGMTFKEAYMSLTTEQRAIYDDLFASKTMQEREANKDTQKTQVARASTTTDGEIIETKHTKKGHDLYVVQMAERVSKEDYQAFNANAKKLGGYYSMYRGQGAVPGFQFTERDNAEAFLKLLKGDTADAESKVAEKRDEFKDDRSQTAVERLNEMADRLEEKADEAINADRKANTARRAGMAARAIANAESQKAMGKTMRNIASAIADGKTKFLKNIRQKSQIEMLDSLLSSARYNYDSKMYDNYSEREKNKDNPFTTEMVDYAEMPNLSLYRQDWGRFGRELLTINGLKQDAKKILDVADDVSKEYENFAKENLTKVTRFTTKDGALASFSSKKQAELSIYSSGLEGKATVLAVKRGEYLIILSPSAAIEAGIWQGDNDKRISFKKSFMADVIKKAESAKVDVPWQLKSNLERLERLERMGIELGGEFRAALREYVTYKDTPQAPSKVKELERKMVGRRNDGLDFFPTPASTSDEMIEAAGIEEGMSVLEPSAGMGHIADRVREAGFEPDVVEFSGDRRELLELKGFNVVGSDFLDVTEKYDRIIMNPPFSDRRDMAHVAHAYNLLKPNGRLVAIMGEGVFFGSDKKATAFREWLDSVGGTSEKLEEGTFNDASLPVNTSVNARMVVIDKADGDAPMFSRANEIDAPIFFSQLSKAIDGAKQDTMPASQWRLWLQSNAAKLGVKKDEIQWTGITDWLELQGKEKVSKADIQSYLDGNGVQVEETMLGNANDIDVSRPETIPDDLQALFDKVDDGDLDVYKLPQQANKLGYIVDIDMGGDILSVTRDAFAMNNPSKYSQYTVEGGENYKELLLTLPEKKIENPVVKWIERVAGQWSADVDGRKFGILEEDRSTFYVYEEDGNLGKKVNSFDLAKQEVDSALVKISKSKYKSSHFDQANILAHVRFDERTDAEGNKVLFINEIQSDFGQDFKKSKDAINNTVDNDFNGVIERMKAAGVLEVNCD